MKKQTENLKLKRKAIAKAKKVDNRNYPIVAALSGLLRAERNTDLKKEYRKYLEQKYGFR